MNIFVVIPETFAGCGFYRLYQPHNHLAKNYDVKITFGNCLLDTNMLPMSDEKIKSFDLFVWHKTLFELSDIKRIKSLGIPTLIDFDDHWVVNREHSLYKQYLKEGISVKLHKALLAVQYVTCTTERLADEIYTVNKNVEVLPNAYDGNYKGWKRERIKEDKYVFGYLGGPCHLRDVGLLKGVQEEVTKTENGYNFRLFGYNGDDIYNRYADILSANKQSENYSIFKGADIWHYPQFYNYLDCSLVPLEDNRFNSMKSELKLIEAGYFKKAVIVSGVYPYKEIAKHGYNCLVANNKSEWIEHIKYLIKNPENELGENLFNSIGAYSINEVNKKRYEYYVHTIRHTNGSDKLSRMEILN